MKERIFKANEDVVRRLKNIRDIWLAINNDPNQTVESCATEFFYTVGDLLEGKYVEQLYFHKINKDRVMRQIKEG